MPLNLLVKVGCQAGYLGACENQGRPSRSLSIARQLVSRKEKAGGTIGLNLGFVKREMYHILWIARNNL